MKSINATLKSFSITDGLLRGTSIIANLVTVGAISVISGFGANALLTASSIQMIVTAILELPAGFLSDRLGAKLILKASLLLKIAVTLVFIFAVYFAYSGYTEIAWLFFTLEVIIDAFANSFLSGSYQASYLHWYKTKCDEILNPDDEPPKLFLASLAFGIKIRFLVPLLVLTFTLFIYYLGKISFKINEIESVFICLIIVFILRLIVWLKVFLDMRNIKFDKISTPKSFGNYLLTLNEVVKGNKMIFVYSVASAINMISLLYFTGLTFKYFYSLEIPKAWAWIYGIFFGSILFYIRTAVAVFLFPKIKDIGDSILTRIIFITLSIVGICGALLFTYSFSNFTQLIIVLHFNFLIAVGAEICLRSIESNLDKYTKNSYRATWISAANTFAYVIFGLTTFLIIKFNFYSIATALHSLLVGILSLSIIIQLKSIVRQQQDTRLAAVIRSNFKKLFFVISLILLVIDLALFSYTNIQIQNDDERRFGTLIHDTVYEPLSQGSIVEAKRRLDKLTSTKSIECADLKIWDFDDSNCQSKSKKTLFIGMQKIELFIGADNSVPDGYLLIFYDRTNIIRSIIIRSIFSFLFFFALWFTVVYAFRKLSSSVEREINNLADLTQNSKLNNDLSKKFKIQEFKQLAQKLESTFELELKISEQALINKISKQVAHDIRSPLTALRAIVSSSQEPSDHKKMLISIAQRIEEIAQDLLSRKQNFLNLSSIDLLLVIKEAISEKSVIFKGQFFVDYEISDHSPLVLANKSSLARIISNIFNNSIEANANSIRIKIRLMNSKIWIDIVDNGSGIPPEIIKKLGKEPISYGKINGHGLGLSHAIATVQSWGGECFVVSEVGKGTTVRITLNIP